MRRRQEPETLTLSEPAATLWRGVRKMLADLRGTDGVAPGDWQIGGSSILAARWRHRRSTDIELSTSGATEQEKLPKNVRNGLAEWPSNIGKTRHRRNGSVVEITFGSTGRLLVRTTRPAPRLGHTTAIVDGEPFETLSTTQILAGKLLGRNAVPPAEDLYDIAAAGEHDPGSLAQAVNMLSPEAQGGIRRGWRTRRDRITTEAAERLQPFGADTPLAIPTAELVDRAARAVENAGYRQIKVEPARVGRAARIRTTDNAGREHTIVVSGHRRDEILEATGMNACVHGRELPKEQLIESLLSQEMRSRQAPTS